MPLLSDKGEYARFCHYPQKNNSPDYVHVIVTMARRPKDINHSLNEKSTSFDERSFVDGVFNNEYILVVGSGVILDRAKFPQTDGDINRYILNEINNDRRRERADFAEHRDFTDVIRATPPDKQDPIYGLLADGIDYELGDISPELTQLLRSRLFKFVLTTTIDGYVEALMRDIWGDELRIVNISDNQSLKDFQTALEACRNGNKYEQPTLFYVFGKVIKGREKPKGFMETDVDAIRYIEKWMKDLDNKYIVPFLKKKRMLALGCKFDDWYFRFFWYILTRSFNDAEREGAKDSDGSILTRDNLASLFNPDDPADRHLKEYLHRRGVCMHDDVWLFMNHIYTLLTSTDADSPFRKMILEKRRMGEIFISYKSCDVLYASELFCRLAREKRLNVWFDNARLNGGDQYEEAIREAVREAKVFIPVLSPAISKDMEEVGEQIDTFYSKEWRWASENGQLIVLPVAIGGYDLRSQQHQVFEHIVKRRTTGIDMKGKANGFMADERTGFAKLLDSIYKQLGVTEP